MNDHSSELRLAAAMAEFEALRAEILSIRGVQKNIISIALATYAALFSFALGEDGDPRLLLVVPPLGLGLCLFQLGESIQIGRLGKYIRTNVWKEVTDLTEYPYSWEKRPHNIVAAILSDGIVPVLLSGAGFVAICTMPDLSGSVKAFQWTCVALTVALPTGCGLYFLANARHGKNLSPTNMADPARSGAGRGGS